MALFLSSASLRSLAAIAHYVPPLSAPSKASVTSNSSSNSIANCSFTIRASIDRFHHKSLQVSSSSSSSSLPSSSSSSSTPPVRFQPSRASASASGSVAEESIHSFTVKDIDGNDVSLSKYKGKVLLIVNVASRCGLTTSNYNELREIHKNLKGQDFEILAFPCNQFGGQEPGSNQEIKQFACSIFKAEFPIFDKVDVNGENTAPVYKFLKATKSSGLLGSLLGDNIKWNFEKFLVDKNGQVVQRYDPTVSPLKIEADIKKLLES